MKNVKAIAIVCLLLCGVAARAQNRRVDFSQNIKALDGSVVMNNTGGDPNAKPVPLTLADVAVNALYTTLDADRALTGEQKFELARLAQKLYKAGPVELTPAEIKTLRDRVGLLYGPQVIGVVWPMLDEAPEVKK